MVEAGVALVALSLVQVSGAKAMQVAQAEGTSAGAAAAQTRLAALALEVLPVQAALVAQE
jgi:hypothetical protein